MTKILDPIEKFSSKQIVDASEKFKLFFSEFLEYIESKLKTVPEKIDIDSLDDDFINNFKRIYSSNVPDTNDLKSLNISDIKRVLKEIVNVNKNKGVIESIEYIFRVLYNSNIEIESGINVGSVVYKPEDYTFETVDEFGNPVQYDPNILSNEPFTFLDDPTIRGFVVTIFLENGTSGTPHLWVENTYGHITDGDMLYFPNINKYIRVLSTNKLELDGWKGKTKRFKTKYFYNSTKFNSKLFSVYKNELYGYDFIDNASYTDYSFGDIYKGKGLIRDLELRFTTGNEDYTHEFDYAIALSDGVTSVIHVKIQTKNRRVVLFEINGAPVDVPNSDILVYRFSAYEFIRQDTLQPVIDKDIITERINRIAMFTFIIHTELKGSIFLNTLRNIVLPAGYNFITIFSIIGDLVDASKNSKILEYSASTPAYFISYTGKKINYSGATALALPNYIKFKFITNLAEKASLTFEHYDKYYKFSLWADKFYHNVDVFDHIPINYLGSFEYKTDSVFEKAVGTYPINKVVKNKVLDSTVNSKSLNYNLSILNKKVENTYPVPKTSQKLKISIAPQQGNTVISVEQFDKYYKFSLWADKFYHNVDVFDHIPVNYIDSPEYKTDSIFEKAVGTYPVNKVIENKIFKSTVNGKRLNYKISILNKKVENPYTANIDRNKFKSSQNLKISIPRQSNISISMEQFDKYYKFSLWADKFFTMDMFDNVPINIDEYPEYTQDLIYNLVSPQTVVKITS